MSGLMRDPSRRYRSSLVMAPSLRGSFHVRMVSWLVPVVVFVRLLLVRSGFSRPSRVFVSVIVGVDVAFLAFVDFWLFLLVFATFSAGFPPTFFAFLLRVADCFLGVLFLLLALVLVVARRTGAGVLSNDLG